MKNRTSGFTLVELMVVVLLVALIGLVSTQIPLFTWRSWTKGSERLKLQRDAHLAMIKIQRKLRPASSWKIDVSDPSRLVIDKDLDPPEEFFWQGNQLVYRDPEGAEETVMEGDAVALFEVTSADGVIDVTLTLDKKNIGTVVLRTAVKPRN